MGKGNLPGWNPLSLPLTHWGCCSMVRGGQRHQSPSSLIYQPRSIILIIIVANIHRTPTMRLMLLLHFMAVTEHLPSILTAGLWYREQNYRRRHLEMRELRHRSLADLLKVSHGR